MNEQMDMITYQAISVYFKLVSFHLVKNSQKTLIVILVAEYVLPANSSCHDVVNSALPVGRQVSHRSLACLAIDHHAFGISLLYLTIAKEVRKTSLCFPG